MPPMLRRGWILERYYGWRVLREDDGLKLLARRRGPLRRALLLANGAAEPDLVSTVRDFGLLGASTVLHLNDFADEAAARREIDGAPVHPVVADRWFGMGTVVLDLARRPDELFDALRPRERTKCRWFLDQVPSRAEMLERPDEGALRQFMAGYGSLAARRGLERPDRALLAAMFSSGDALLARLVAETGSVLASHVVYRGADYGYFYQGARSDGAPSGASHVLHLRTADALRDRGLRWYDLGLLPARAADDGLVRFKRSFGGVEIPYGSEYRRAGALAGMMERVSVRLAGSSRR